MIRENMSLICVTLTEEDVSGVFESARKCMALGADIIEVRLDYLKGNALHDSLRKLSRLREEVGLPVILTIRPAWGGGKYESTEENRLALMGQAIEHGFDYIDLELKTQKPRRDAIVAKARESGVTTIISHHDYVETPSRKDVLFLVMRCLEAGGDIAKVVVTAHDFMDAVDVISAGREALQKNLRFVTLAMGRYGHFTRYLGPVVGCEIVYASLENGKEAALGQVDIKTLKRTFNFETMNPNTAICGIIGNPLEHSLSPIMHNSAFAELKLNFIYVPLEFPEIHLEAALEGMKSLDFIGLNVTHPYKSAIMNYLDGMDENAGEIGAVNTVMNVEGKLLGYNTDSSGAVEALKGSGVDVQGGQGRVLILGAGGAARAIGVPLAKAGWEIIIANRTFEKGKNLADMLSTYSNVTAVSVEGIGDVISEVNLLINCTSVGMKGYPQKNPIPVSFLRSDMTVFDMVYSPMRTPLLTAAEKAGAKIIFGYEMFVRQGIEAFELWTQQKAPADVMRKVVLDELDA